MAVAQCAVEGAEGRCRLAFAVACDEDDDAALFLRALDGSVDHFLLALHARVVTLFLLVVHCRHSR